MFSKELKLYMETCGPPDSIPKAQKPSGLIGEGGGDTT